MLNNFRSRVREPGLVTPKSLYRIDRITNNTFDSSITGWSANAPATITASGAKANLARNSLGYRIDMIYQDLTNIIIGDYYIFMVDLTALNSPTQFVVTLGSTALLSNVTTLMSYRVIFQWGEASTSARLGIALANNLTGTATIDNIYLRHTNYYDSLNIR